MYVEIHTVKERLYSISSLMLSKILYESISQQTNDPIIVRHTSTISGEKFPVFLKDTEMRKTLSPTIGGKTFLLPEIYESPTERQQQRLAFRNSQYLYRGICDFSKKPIISFYAPERGYKVYDPKIWRSDQRDAMDYGQEYRLGVSFFQQFKALYDKVPKLARITTNSENSDYTSFSDGLKNCYLCFTCVDCEDCLYSYRLNQSNNAVDTLYCYESQWIYECIDCQRCFQCLQSQNLIDCSQCSWCFECSNSQNCFLSSNLVGKSFCILNKQYTKEEYLEKIKEYRSLDQNQLGKLFEELKMKAIHRSVNNVNTTHCSGNYLRDSQDLHLCFDYADSENLRYCYAGIKSVDCMDCSFTIGEKSYHNMSLVGSYGCILCVYCRHSSNMIYCDTCQVCQYCFGCVGLKNKQYCIFNKQYSKEEYESTVIKIIEDMMLPHSNPDTSPQSLSKERVRNNEGVEPERGQFFPSWMSPFSYQETLANMYYPLSKEEAMKRGYNRFNIESKKPETTEEIISSKNLPSIEDTSDDIIKKVIFDEEAQKYYRITSQELVFYRKLHIDLPHHHPDTRRQARFSQRDKQQLSLRHCSKTGEEMISVYPTDTSFPVYSEQAYNQKMFG